MSMHWTGTIKIKIKVENIGKWKFQKRHVLKKVVRAKLTWPCEGGGFVGKTHTFNFFFLNLYFTPPGIGLIVMCWVGRGVGLGV